VVDTPPPGDLDAILGLPPAERIEPLARLGRRLLDGIGDTALKARTAKAIATLIDEGVGSGHERLGLGEVVGWLGDVRLRTPKDADYWADVEVDDGRVKFGRFLVTNHEWRAFIEAGGYQDKSLWGDEGWAWLQACEDPWPEKSKGPEARPFVVPNQPVVGVSWWEASAYAKANQARLPGFDERVQAIRGKGLKRPYPWGSPFGEANANTREEVLGRPSAVGLYVKDRIPEGVCDLAGNVAEWTEDGVGDQRFYAPGAFNEPSMAAWAKAREIAGPGYRSAALGFRLVRD
jgi:formylglycine-generating enzyme required for sulfatase activity